MVNTLFEIPLNEKLTAETSITPLWVLGVSAVSFGGIPDLKICHLLAPLKEWALAVNLPLIDNHPNLITG